MFLFLSKTLPLFLYPIGFATLILFLVRFFAKRTERWHKTMLTVAFFALWLGGNELVSYAVSWPLEHKYLPADPMPNSDVIVVLGGGTEVWQSPRPIPELNSRGDRLLYAAYLYKQGVSPNILVTGGGSPWRGAYVEADNMQAVLEIMGVPAEAIWQENRSTNTYENGAFSREILAEKGIDEIVLVTSAVHMPRSVAIFEKQGFSVIPAATDFKVVDAGWGTFWDLNIRSQIIHLIPDANYLLTTTRALKEYVGIIVYWARGWL